MSDSASIDSFIDKWRARWPEWNVLSAFVPAAQRQRLWAWMSLLQELGDAAWAGSDPTPGLAKLAWWQEELRGWARGARRHPLGETLQKLDAPWETLANALRALPASRADAAPAEDVAALLPLAAAILACEAALFGDSGASANAVETRDGVPMLCVLRGERALAQGDRDAARTLSRGWPGVQATRPRRLQNLLLRHRLQAFAEGAEPRPPGPLRLLFAGWRAARGD